MAVEKYEGEKKLLTGASGDLSLTAAKARLSPRGATACGSKGRETANLKFEISDRDKAKSRSLGIWSPVDSAVPECRKNLRHFTEVLRPDLSRHGTSG